MKIETSCFNIKSTGGSFCSQSSCERFMSSLSSLNHEGKVDEESRADLIKRIWFHEHGSSLGSRGETEACINAVLVKSRSLGLLRAATAGTSTCEELEQHQYPALCTKENCRRMLHTIQLSSETEAQLKRRNIEIFNTMLQMWGRGYFEYADCYYSILDAAKAAGIYQVAEIQLLGAGSRDGNYTFTLI